MHHEIYNGIDENLHNTKQDGNYMKTEIWDYRTYLWIWWL